MNTITWLHLADWHRPNLVEPNKKDYNYNIITQKLLDDIKTRYAIDNHLETIDFVVFSGNLVSSGKVEEFNLVYNDFLHPVLEAANVSSEHLCIVPGNHDLNREEFEFLPADQSKAFSRMEDDDIESHIEKLLYDERHKEELLKPFNNYKDFIYTHLYRKTSAYADINIHPFSDKRIVFLGFNSALMCGRPNDVNEINDERVIFIGEHQVLENLNQIEEKTDIVISVMYHPFSWLHKADIKRVEPLIKSKSRFILHGHGQKPRASQIKDTSGNCMIISAGVSSKKKSYYNSYNFVQFDLDKQEGRVFFRCWSNEIRKWRSDIDAAENGIFNFSFPMETSTHTLPSLSVIRQSAQKNIFIYSQNDDYPHCLRVAEDLKKYAIKNVILPMDIDAAKQASADEITSDHRDCMSTCDVVILIYANASNAWIREQIRQCIRHSRTESNLRCIAVFIINSNSKPQLNISNELVEQYYCSETGIDFVSTNCIPKFKEKLQEI